MTSLEEQVQAYREITSQIADLEQKKREMSLAILGQMMEKSVSIGDYVVRRYDRLSFRTSIEQARELGATKTEEVLDKDALKKLHCLGQSVPGVSSVSVLQVSVKKK